MPERQLSQPIATHQKKEAQTNYKRGGGIEKHGTQYLANQQTGEKCRKRLIGAIGHEIQRLERGELDGPGAEHNQAPKRNAAPGDRRDLGSFQTAEKNRQQSESKTANEHKEEHSLRRIRESALILFANP